MTCIAEKRYTQWGSVGMPVVHVSVVVRIILKWNLNK